MKTKTLLSLAALLGSSSLAIGVSFSFDLMGDGTTNVTGMSVSGTIDFTDGNTTVTFDVTNNSDYQSSLTEFYILKPLKNGSPVSAATLDTPTSTDWGLVNQLDNDTYQYVKNISGLTKTAYFGVALHPPGSSDGIDMGASQQFSFTMTESSPYSWEYDNELPFVVARWQSIVGANQGSAKGYGAWGPDFEPAVPEPSHIASLAALGLGGLLFVRRRLTRKQK